MRCASYVPYPVAGPKKCCGKHAELIPVAKYVLRPGGNKGIPLTHTAIPKISQNLLPGRNAIPPVRPANPVRIGRSVNQLFTNEESAHQALLRLEQPGDPVARRRYWRRPPFTSGTPSEAEVEIRGRVPATGLAALAHPAA